MRRHNYYALPGFERAALRRRETAWIAERLIDAASLFVPVWRNRNLVIEIEGGETRAVTLGMAGLGPLLGHPFDAAERLARGEAVFLGIVGERAHFALDLSAVDAPFEVLHEAARAASGLPSAEARLVDLRQLAGRLDGHEAGLLAHARAMMYWHARHRFCGVCGQPTRSEEAGHMRRCIDPACDALHFPRTDPAVIMLVTHGEDALLGRSRQFPPGMYSTLAGFVEPGESLEDAVAREVREEVGIAVGAVHYHSSQPWPFPANIMLGFYTEAQGREIALDLGELEDARWVGRRWLAAHADDDTFRLPRRDSIARRLIEDWLSGQIETAGG
jgi:NAD+ diphosphatase